jgi:SAM-dependent methyltransferase
MNGHLLTAPRIDMTGAFESTLAEEYIRERIDPKPGEPLYLHLSDLALGLSRYATNDALRVLDYGCGSSPYKTLFPNADYRRADAIDAPDLDYRVGENQTIAERAGYFDLVLSTQVLEHVPEPSRYLVECYRLLRQGGRLIISTHGLFEEHGVPYDFHRWTAVGLKGELENAGFEVAECHRLTTNGRAMAFLLERHGAMLFPRRRTPWGLGLWLLHSTVRRFNTSFHTWCDSAFASSRVVDGSTPGRSLTIGLLCSCVKQA